jgi:hypothetical protein
VGRFGLDLLVVFVAIHIVWIGAAWYDFLRTGVTGHNYRRLAVGMTFQQVEELLGRKFQVQVCDKGMDGIPLRPEEVETTTRWRSDELTISVVFDKKGCIESFGAAFHRPGGRELIDRIRSW